MGSFKSCWCRSLLIPVVIFTKTKQQCIELWGGARVSPWAICSCTPSLGFNLWFWSRGHALYQYPLQSSFNKSQAEYLRNGKTRLQGSLKMTRVISYDANKVTISDSLFCNMFNKVQYTLTSFNTFSLPLKAPDFAFVHSSYTVQTPVQGPVLLYKSIGFGQLFIK